MTFSKPVSYSQISHRENTFDGHNVIVYNPSYHSTKLKHRKYNDFIDRYGQPQALFSSMQSNFKVVRIKDFELGNTDVEYLAFLTHRLIEIEDTYGKTNSYKVPRSNVGDFRQRFYKNLKSPEQKHSKCISDSNGIAVIYLRYHKDLFLTTKTNSGFNKGNGKVKVLETEVKFSIYYINTHALQVTSHSGIITALRTENFCFRFILSNSILYIIWFDTKRISKLDFQKPKLEFEDIFTNSIIPDNCVIKITSRNIGIINKDESFSDSVFSVEGLSKRKTSFCDTEFGKHYFRSNDILTKIAETVYLDHPTDVIYVDRVKQPLWVVTEWLAPAMTLSKLIFYWKTKDSKYRTKILDFERLFTEYKRFFRTPNESQLHGFEICPLTWQLFLWSSRTHILVIDLENMKVDCMLQLQADKFKDLHQDVYNYQIKISRSGQEVDVLVTKRVEYVHYESFRLPPKLSLKKQVIVSLLKNHSLGQLRKSILPVDLIKEIEDYY